MTAPIASRERVPIGGIKQTIITRGYDEKNPLLLFVSGGPGMPEGGLVRHYLPNLEKMFTVVDWEQRGSGLTGAEKTPDESMTVARLQSDLIELSRYLIESHKKDRIYLFAHSFGTVMATLAARDRPELYHAYIGCGQVTNQVRSERLGYEFCMRKAKDGNDEKAVKSLSSIAYPTDGSYINKRYPTHSKSVAVQRKWLGTYGGVTKDPKKLMGMMMKCVFNSEHSLIQSARFMGRFNRSMDLIWPLVFRYDMARDVPELKIPVFLVNGEHDMDTPTLLVKEYFRILKAPKKELFILENSSHMAPFEEPEEFCRVMRKLLEITS